MITSRRLGELLKHLLKEQIVSPIPKLLPIRQRENSGSPGGIRTPDVRLGAYAPESAGPEPAMLGRYTTGLSIIFSRRKALKIIASLPVLSYAKIQGNRPFLRCRRVFKGI